MNSPILKSLILILFSCNNHEQATYSTNETDTSIVSIKQKDKNKKTDISDIGIDTTINGNLVLWNSESMYSAFGDLSGKLQEYPNEGAFVVFKNKQGDKFLKMVHLPGSDPNTFRFFEVGYVNTLDKKVTLLSSSIENFETESGVKLGMAISDFEKGRDKNYSKTTQVNDISFKISDTIDGLEYIATYHFKGGQLIKFGFGYSNP